MKSPKTCTSRVEALQAISPLCPSILPRRQNEREAAAGWNDQWNPLLAAALNSPITGELLPRRRGEALLTVRAG